MNELRRETDLLIRQVGHWGQPRWNSMARNSGTRSKADVVHGLIQRLADRCADVEAQPRRAVPRLDNDLALIDQLRVMTNDLVDTDAPTGTLSDARADIAATRQLL